MINSFSELKTRIRIQKKRATSGSGSFAKTEWIDIGNEKDSDYPRFKYSKWVGAHGTEAWIADSVQAERAATVTVRFDNRIDETCRILYNETIYKIVSIDNPDQQRHWLEIKVKAAVNG